MLVRHYENIELRQKISIKVLNDITPLVNDDYDWCAIDDNSLFSVENNLPSCGWNLLELSLVHNVPSASAHFYFDTGFGFCEEDKIVLPSVSVIYLLDLNQFVLIH